MVQMRLMGDDPERVREVADLVLAALQDSGLVTTGDTTELPNRRDGGLRIVAEVIPKEADGPIQATAERMTPQPASHNSRTALPPGRRRIR